MTFEKIQPGTWQPIALQFVAGSITEIISFNDFDSIKCEVWTGNFPVSEIALTVTGDLLSGEISEAQTANMYGQIFMRLTFVFEGKAIIQKFPLDLFVDKIL